MFLHLSVSHSVHRGVCIQEGSGLHPLERLGRPSIAYYGILSMSGWCACYWNAFFFINVKMCEMAAWGTVAVAVKEYNFHLLVFAT